MEIEVSCLGCLHVNEQTLASDLVADLSGRSNHILEKAEAQAPTFMLNRASNATGWG